MATERSSLAEIKCRAQLVCEAGWRRDLVGKKAECCIAGETSHNVEMSRPRLFSRAQRLSSPISYPLRSCAYDKGIAAASTCCLQESHVTLVCHVKPPLFFSLIANLGQTQCILFILVPSKLFSLWVVYHSPMT